MDEGHCHTNIRERKGRVGLGPKLAEPGQGHRLAWPVPSPPSQHYSRGQWGRRKEGCKVRDRSPGPGVPCSFRWNSVHSSPLYACCCIGCCLHNRWQLEGFPETQVQQGKALLTLQMEDGYYHWPSTSPSPFTILFLLP